MKRWTLVLGFYGFVVSSAQADDRSAFVMNVLQAIAARTQCTGTEIFYEDWVARAAEMHLPSEIVEQTRLAIAYSLTKGQLGEAQNTELMRTVSIVGKMIDLDQSVRRQII
jgi:hypothetical protein